MQEIPKMKTISIAISEVEFEVVDSALRDYMRGEATRGKERYEGTCTTEHLAKVIELSILVIFYDKLRRAFDRKVVEMKPGLKKPVEEIAKIMNEMAEVPKDVDKN